MLPSFALSRAYAFLVSILPQSILADMVTAQDHMDHMDHMDRIVAQWRRERPDLDVEPIGVLGRLFRSALLADETLAAGIAPYGLQPGWFDLLAALRRSGKPYELNPTKLMETTMLSSGGMTKRLDRLDEAGLVERRPDPSDRRGTLVRLTRHGKAVIDKAVVTHASNEDQLLRSLSAADRLALDGLLRKFLAGLEGPEPRSKLAPPARR
jgi:DNA-binding MarR family transcriptional regulator